MSESTVSESQSLLSSVEGRSVTETQPSLPLPLQLTWAQYCRPRYGVRRFRSKGALLVLLWSTAAFCALRSPFTPYIRGLVGDVAVDLLLGALAFMYCPLAGLFGDIYFGRHKFLHANALIMWFGSIIVVLGQTLVQYQFSNLSTVLEYCVILPAYSVVMVAFFGIQVTSVTFGIDQLPAASTEEISSFVHWLIWGWILGSVIGDIATGWYNCTHNTSVAILLSLLPAIAASLILCTNYLCKGWLILEPRCQNPLRNITGVLKYALTHKYPARRSAFTYWEDRIPSRTDLGKSKYGGPYTNEQVEDVKSFFRIIVATVSILAFIVPTEATSGSVNFYHYQHLKYTCYDSFRLQTELLAALCIPVYEFMVYPLFRNWIPSSLKRTAFFGSITVAVTIYLIMLEIVGQTSAGSAIPCMFQADKHSTTLPINYFAVDVPVGLLTAFQWTAFNIAAFEFICAQSPYHMMGLLTGLAVLMINVAIGLGRTVYYVWSQNMEHSTLGLSCGTWYYLFTMVIGFVGLVLLIAVGKWYKERERDDIVNEHRFAESYYGNHNTSS